MNIELLNRVKAHILEEPRRFYMSTIISRKQGGARDGDMQWPECGTVGCFAGWAFVLSGHSVEDMFFGRAAIAQEALGLTNAQAGRLFYDSPEEWSEEDRQKLWSGDGSPETAALAARRIDLFIESDGQQ